jgi:hypothetical protein
VVLVAIALGLGTFGLFCSTIVKRTQAATVITVFGVLAITIGSVFVLYFWSVMAGLSASGHSGFGPIKGRPPEVIAYLNPFLAQADIICGTQTVYGDWCSRYTRIMGSPEGTIFTTSDSQPPQPVPAKGAVGNSDVLIGSGPPVTAEVTAFGVTRDQFWPKAVIAWLVVSLVLLIASIQLVSPTRRWRPGRSRRGPPGPDVPSEPTTPVAPGSAIVTTGDAVEPDASDPPAETDA